MSPPGELSASSADSAGVPWAGRRFAENRHATDDGAAPEAVTRARAALAAGEQGREGVIVALAGARLLLPLIAEAGDVGLGAHGQPVDKTQELSLVTVRAPDGRTALPAFTSVAALAAWNPDARPIPVESSRVALAAAAEATPLIVLDPGPQAPFVIRHPSFRSLATGERWIPAHEDEKVATAVHSVLERGVAADAHPMLADVRVVSLTDGDPNAQLSGPDLVVTFEVSTRWSGSDLEGLAAWCAVAWGSDATLTERVDGWGIRFVARND